MSQITQEALQNAFLQISKAKTTDDLVLADRVFRKAFLDFGSETPDNKAALDALVIKAFDPGFDQGFGGLALAATDEPLSSILNSAEGCEIPKEIKHEHPTMTQSDWSAVLRIATMVMIAFESHTYPAVE